MDKLSTHALAALLIFMAVSMSILQWVHRKERRRLFLAGPPGSIASDVSLTSSAKFGLLLNAGDTQKDMRRKLQGMRFGIERATGQIIVEKESSVSSYVPEDVRYPSEDVRASLLGNPADAKSAVQRDSFVGLRDDEKASYPRRSVRQSAVSTVAPLVSSPLASARFSQTKFTPLHSPSPSASTTTFLRPIVAGSTIVTSPPPPPSSTSMRFSTSTTVYPAPAGPPPPQLQAQDSYHDPYAPKAA